MAVYTAQEVATLVDGSDIEAKSYSDIDEDPDLPLPLLDSADEESPNTSPTPRGSVPCTNIREHIMLLQM